MPKKISEFFSKYSISRQKLNWKKSNNSGFNNIPAIAEIIIKYWLLFDTSDFSGLRKTCRKQLVDY